MNELDPLAAVTADDPYPYYARLVADGPFSYDQRCRMFVAASAQAVETVLSSAVMRVRPPSGQIPRSIVDTPLGDLFQRLLRMTDGSSQVALKRAVHATLDTMDLCELAATSERCAELLLRNVSPDDSVDVSSYIFGLPALVIAAALGFARENAPQAIAWTKLLVRSFVSGHADDVVCGIRAVESMTAELYSLPATPPTTASLFADFLTVGRRRGIDDTVIVANAIGFLSQSYDATAGLIGNVLIALAAAPRELRDSVIDDPDLLERVIAETARYDSPIQNTRRFAAGKVMIMGSSLREGDAVLVVLAAANRDPCANRDPHCFDLTRTARRTYTFGIGTHACPGARIATTIARAGVAQLLRFGIDLGTLRSTRYYPSANARIPDILVARRRVAR